MIFEVATIILCLGKNGPLHGQPYFGLEAPGRAYLEYLGNDGASSGAPRGHPRSFGYESLTKQHQAIFGLHREELSTYQTIEPRTQLGKSLWLTYSSILYTADSLGTDTSGSRAHIRPWPSSFVLRTYATYTWALGLYRASGYEAPQLCNWRPLGYRRCSQYGVIQ